MKKSKSIGRPCIIMTRFTSHQQCFLESLFRLFTQGHIIVMLELMSLVIACLYNTQNDVGCFTRSLFLLIETKRVERKPNLVITMEKLPVEILELVLRETSLIERFKIARTCKSLYEKIRHIPLEITYNINSINGEHSIGSFFYSTVVSVNVVIDQDPINYSSLKKMLSVFYYLRSITVKGDIPPMMGKRIISTFPMAPSIIDLKLYCDSNSRTIIQKHVQSITKRNIIVEDNDTTNKKRKRTVPTIQTPSPLKEALRPMKQMYETSKRELCKLMTLDVEPDVSVPVALLDNNITTRNEYKTLQIKDLLQFNIKENPELEDINEISRKLANTLAECIIQFDDDWVFVTEYEMYFRNCKSIDDCAQESFWLTYPGNIEVHKLKKNEKGHSWFELCMFYDRFELLVTGGFRGDYCNDNIVPFLGSVLQSLRPINHSGKVF